jgi:ribonuclease BN (tRNA processing enzyme)
VSVRIRFLGTGNAFAAGGRSHACILLEHPGGTLLLDCGASALPAIVRTIDPEKVDAVAVTHLHGDHFVGIPFLLDERKWNGRTRPMTLAGPPSLEKRVQQVGTGAGMDLSKLPFECRFVVLGNEPAQVGGAEIVAIPVKHSPDSEPHGMRVRVDGKLIAYTGDAVWTDALVRIADGADLLICECTWFEKRDPVHLNAQDLVQHRTELRAKRVLLTHLGVESLAHRGELPFEVAEEGMEIVL